MTDKTDASKDSPETTAATDHEKGNGAPKATEKGKSSAVWMGTAVGVGSAALVAALMYANRRNKKG